MTWRPGELTEVDALQRSESPALPVLTEVLEEGLELMPFEPVSPGPVQLDMDELARQVMERLEGLLQARMRQMLEGVVETLVTEQANQLADDLRPEMHALVSEAIQSVQNR
jgi:hypothetical protein